jgi:hypothetical protein
MVYPGAGLSWGTSYFLPHQELSAEEREYWTGMRLRRPTRCCRSSRTTGTGPVSLPPGGGMAKLGIAGGGIEGCGCPP